MHEKIVGMHVDSDLWWRRYAELVAYETDQDRIVQARAIGPEVLRQARKGRVAATWTTGPTGRVHSSWPNLQGITRRRYPTELGGPTGGLRDAVTAPDGWALVSVDWTAAHLWIAAGITGDDALEEDLRGGEVYESAAQLWGVDRATAKLGILAGLGGAGDARLREILGSPSASAGDMLGWWPGLRPPAVWDWVTPSGRAVSVPPDRRPGGGRPLASPVSWRLQSIEADALAHAIDHLPASARLAHMAHDELLIEVRDPGDAKACAQAMTSALAWATGLSPSPRMASVSVGATWSGAPPVEAPPAPPGCEVPAGPVREGGAWGSTAALAEAEEIGTREGVLDLIDSPWLPYLTHEPALARLPSRRTVADLRRAARQARRAQSPTRGAPVIRPDQPYVLIPKGEKAAIYVRSPLGRYVRYENSRQLRGTLGDWWPEVTTVDDEGVSLTAPALCAMYGVSIDREDLDYAAEGGRYVPPPDGGDLGVLVSCPLPPSDVTPEYDPDCAAWLDTLGPDVIHWVSALSRLDRPVAALVLHGAPGTGKSMLADACARLFGTEVANFRQIFIKGWSESLEQQPVVVCHEAIPAGDRVDPSELREKVGSSRHTVTRKNVTARTLKGHLRLIISANNPDPLRMAVVDLTQADRDAIGERFLFCHVPAGARAWLQKHGGREGTFDWVDGGDGPGRLVRHIAWLQGEFSPRPADANSRWLVPGDATQWLDHIRRHSDDAMRILDALRVARDSSLVRDVIYRDTRWPGKLLVNAQALAASWHVVDGPHHPWGARKIGRALRVVSGMDASFVASGAWGRKRMWTVDEGAIDLVDPLEAVWGPDPLEEW